MEIKEVRCDNCQSVTIYACVGISECYVCKECYNLLLAKKLTLLDMEEKRAIRRNK